MVAGRLGRGVAREVLERRHHATRLQSPDVRGPHDADEIRVLSERLLDAAPPVVAHDVEHGREPLVDAHRTHALPDRPRHALHGVGVEGSGPRQRRREDGGAEGGEAGQALLVRDRRHAKPCTCDQVLLQSGEAPRTLDRIHRPGPERARQVSHPVGAGRLERHGIRERLLHRRHVARAELRPDPDAGQLGELLVESHRVQQRLHAFGERPRRVRPWPSAERPIRAGGVWGVRARLGLLAHGRPAGSRRGRIMPRHARGPRSRDVPAV
jgi:hypothetical protein